MTRHQIIGSEIGRDRPVAYVVLLPQRRRPHARRKARANVGRLAFAAAALSLVFFGISAPGIF
ncbi:MAG TPA: hypothetical protein VD929_06920 [Caulobacteraceae bacterium]|nr:hypothetical protein [Caulobacteraceae bacterium]